MARKSTKPLASLPNNIRALREAREWSQARLGAALVPPVTQQQIDKLETGKTKLSFDYLRSIAAALEVTWEEIVLDQTDPILRPKNEHQKRMLQLMEGLSEEDQAFLVQTGTKIAKPADSHPDNGSAPGEKTTRGAA